MRDFILEKLQDQRPILGTNLEMMARLDFIEREYNKIEGRIKKSGINNKLEVLIQQELQEKQLAMAVQFPSKNKNEQDCVKTWFASDCWKEIEKKNLDAFDKMMKSDVPDPRGFTEFGTTTRFVLSK